MAALSAATDSVIAFPVGHRIEGATASGYLTHDNATSVRSWVRASDGAVTALPGSSYASVLATGHEDLVAVRSQRGSAELQDMATGQVVFDVALDPHGGLDYAGAAGRTLFTTDTEAAAVEGLRMHVPGGTPVPVTGLPADATQYRVRPGTPAHALVTYTANTTERHWGLIDLVTGAVTETGRWGTTAGTGDIAVSTDRVAWVEGGTTAAPTTAVVRSRATGTTQRISLAGAVASYLEIGLQGDYLTYSQRFGLSAYSGTPFHALTAYHLTDGTTSQLLSHIDSAETSPDGGLYARGGTVAEGEGLYRIAPGVTGGAPTATLVASTGEPTKLTLVGHNIPAEIDLSRGDGTFDFSWIMSRPNAAVEVVLRHIPTGQRTEAELYNPLPNTSDFGFPWTGAGRHTPFSISPYNGEYTWSISARPDNGIGPVVNASGTFKVIRSAPAPHDFNDNGSPDLIARFSLDALHRSDTYWDSTIGGGLVESGYRLLDYRDPWNDYDRIEATGNLGGAGTGDLVTRDKSGVLWLYLGKGDGTFAARSRVGGGWGVYDKIAAGSDLTNDGKADLLATDKSGVLWLYRGTGDWRAPFASRSRVGGGWGIYNQLTATGDVGGAASGDLVARDTSGVLWLYLGKGDGTFASRSRIGGGWNAYMDTVGIGDANHDGRPDLYACGDGMRYFYAGTGDWRAPFAARTVSTLFPQPTNLMSIA
ncbi:FG-GAP repeat domain-containing protein [Streptomyces sp. NPDC005930]|uniref:FG-GAP repeat domain-containing protein n=1 Tax=Streptomyces sp. NPDC005930 TaxID=3364736 RepID=UPI0036861B1B